MNTNWKKEIQDEMECQKDPGPLVSNTLSEQEMNDVFDAGFGGSNGVAFTAWTETRVYFPVVYDGAEWVGSVPRNPCDERVGHLGGE